ncbi:glycoside hydrolase family 5 protein [Deinococcus sp. VB343]|uniref:Cellulase family glycosylhydrolase n=1 Tax=Deinococcus sp. VB142 TaxID=3112952 RepID=A0AAU6Q6D5_9DEIO
MLGVLITFLLLGEADGQTLQLRRGITLEGWLDQPEFRAVSREQLSQLPLIRKEGFDFVRLTVHAGTLMRGLDPRQEPVASLERVLDAARVNNLKVVIALTDTYPKRVEVMKGGKFFDTYLVLIEKFGKLLSKRDPRWVGFTPLDEPTDCEMKSDMWRAQLQRYASAFRKSAPGMTLLLPGHCFANQYSLMQLTPLSDRNIIYTFQYVDPIPFTQQGNRTNEIWQWFKNVPYPATQAQADRAIKAVLAGLPDPKLRDAVSEEFRSYGMTGFSRQSIEDAFNQASSWAKLNGVQVMLSVFGANERAPQVARATWFRDVRMAAEKNRMPWAVWTWTSPFGYGLTTKGKLKHDIKVALGLR